MQPLEIKKDIFWVGAVDYGSYDFHGYSRSPRGTTYNAYVIKDEKKVLVDTVKREFSGTLRCRLANLMNPEEIDYIVVNHVELDHSGVLPAMIELCRPEAVYCSPMGQKNIEAHFRGWEKWPLKVVKTGDAISIGKRNLQFIETRMLHWPDSMGTYIPQDKVLFSNDAFGQNIASSERFSDELEKAALEQVLSEYYNNIVLPFSQQVLKVLDQFKELGLEIDMLAPDHGLIFRNAQEVQFALECYRRYAEQKTQPRAVIVYDTMWHSTEKMAYAIGEGLSSEGVPYRIMDLKHHHHSEVMAEVGRCGLVIVGSPTHNNGILPPVAGFLTYMKGLRPQNRLGGAFGSFGWSGESVKLLSDWLREAHFELPVEPVKGKYIPGHDVLGQCADMGRALGAALKSKVAGA